MADNQVRQRLAAILAADVAGYARLMGRDERATIGALDACRAVFRDRIAAAGGRVVDMAGDSVLAVFDTAAGAVSAAAAVQSALSESGASEPEHRRMRYRIGVHLGDIFEKGDGSVYGDGVNVAARLQSIGEPGMIAVSDAIHAALRGRGFGFTDLGEHAVKNIDHPVRAFRVETKAVAPTAAAPKPVDKPSIVVLPFINMSSDREQEYFSDGITEDVITDISKVSGLFVIARNSAFAFKGQSADIRTVCRELGVRYVLEGSVRKAGGRVRVTAQLIDGATGGHLWAERYDRDLEDIFAVQDDVTRSIVAALKVTLTAAEETGIARRGTSNLEAYDAFMRGREWTIVWKRDAHETARPLLEKAVALDPSFAAPLAYLAMIRVVAYINRWSDDWATGLSDAHDLASRAVALDELSSHAHYALGNASLWQGRHAEAIAESRRAIELDPNLALAHGTLGMALHYTGESTAALPQFETVIRLNPKGDDVALHQVALCQFMLGDYDAAAATLRDRIAQAPSTDASRALLAAAYGHMGRVDDARAVWDELKQVNPDYAFAERRKVLPYKDPRDPERIADGLRKAGLET